MSSNSTTNHTSYFAIYILQTIQIILKNLINKQKVGHYSCIFRRSPYLCIVFFIVLDLRLTRLGYSGIPFFLSLCQDAPRCVRLERHMCHPVKLFAPKDFLLCRCWWGWALLAFSFFPAFYSTRLAGKMQCSYTKLLLSCKTPKRTFNAFALTGRDCSNTR